MRTKLSKVVLGLMFVALLIPTMGSDGCRDNYGHGYHGDYDDSYTDFSFGVDTFSDWFSDDYYEETYYEEGYYDDGYYDDGYYDDGYYGDDWKAKNPGRT